MNKRVLVIGDLHCPCDRKYYLEFCKEIYKKYKCNETVFIGDVIDNHAISFHATHPEMPGPSDEYELAFQHVQRWYKAFPNAKIAVGNHCERMMRLAESVSIPSKFLRNYSEIWETPKWDWKHEHTIDGVLYLHGTGCGGGMNPAYNTVRKMSLSVVMGHFHSAAGIKWLVNPNVRMFGMDVGTGIDDSALAFAYGKFSKIRSVVSCGVVVDSHPYLELMPISKGEKYYDHESD
jgi:hypothetical protein